MSELSTKTFKNGNNNPIRTNTLIKYILFSIGSRPKKAEVYMKKLGQQKIIIIKGK